MCPGDGQVIGVIGGEVVQTLLATGQTGALITHTRTFGALKLRDLELVFFRF